MKDCPNRRKPASLRAAVRYPVMLKAVAGGGGKGMRRVDREADLEAAFRDASSEAERAFGDGAIYVEKLIERPRHIEIQIFGDHHGNVVHLGERECSIQRRHQKIIEECPSPLVALHPEMRARWAKRPCKIARAAGYYNAGTVEFLADESRNFYFLEMNTRLQVEHPVTELVTGSTWCAGRSRLRRAASCPSLRSRSPGEARRSSAACTPKIRTIKFFPSPGRISGWPNPRVPACASIPASTPAGTCRSITIRCWRNSWCGPPTARSAIARMRRAIGEYRISGIRTNLSFFDRILADQEFCDGRLDTGFLERLF